MIAFIFLLWFPTPPQRLPDLAGPCNYGKMFQTNKKVFLISETYFATGEIRPDGLVYLRWGCNNSAVAWVGLYKLTEDGHLSGHFGLEDQVTISESDICGTIHQDRITFRRK